MQMDVGGQRANDPICWHYILIKPVILHGNKFKKLYLDVSHNYVGPSKNYRLYKLLGHDCRPVSVFISFLFDVLFTKVTSS